VSVAIPVGDRDRDASASQNRRVWEYATEPPRTPPPDEEKRGDARTGPAPPGADDIYPGKALPPREIPDDRSPGEDQLLEKGRYRDKREREREREMCQRC
jgi:hypothetical protein